MTGVSEAYFEACMAVGRLLKIKPLAPGLSVVETEEWAFGVNNSKEPVKHEGVDIEPFELVARHKVYLLFAVMGPAGGMIGGGMPEDEFIAQMKAICPDEATAV